MAQLTLQEEIDVIKSIYHDKLKQSRGTSGDIAMVTVSVNARFDSINVLLDIPDEKYNLIESKYSKTNHLGVEQTTGRVRITANVCALPEVLLHAGIPENYPCTIPTISISCCWLTANDISSMTVQLQRIWNDNQGVPVLYSWINWIENDLVPHTTTVQLQNHSHDESIRIFEEILKVDSVERQHVFNTCDQICPICCSEDIGTKFFKFDNCQHVFCKSCVTAFLAINVRDATVGNLSCPGPTCSSDIPVHIVRELLSANDFMRYEELKFMHIINSMTNIIHCTRCGSDIINDEVESDVVKCPSCNFVFCPKCKEAYHPPMPCQSMDDKLEQLRALTEEMGLNFDEVLASEKLDMDMITVDRWRQKNIDYMLIEALRQEQRKKEERRLVMLRLKEEILCEATIEKTTKPCPKCDIAIEKNMGCDRVVCTRCGTVMCYSCGKEIISKIGYDHFGSDDCIPQPLPAFEPEDQPPIEVRPIPPKPGRPGLQIQAYLDIQAQLMTDPALKRQIVQCVCCGQPNVKRDQNNHMRCLSCKQSWCYCCQMIITKKKNHFGAAKDRCLQHS